MPGAAQPAALTKVGYQQHEGGERLVHLLSSRAHLARSHQRNQTGLRRDRGMRH
jgi:hypothetical protein